MGPEFSPQLRAELLDDFYTEADEHLGQMRTQLTQLERAGAHAAPDPSVTESIFRSMHSLKGICAMAGLHPAEELAHAAEGFLRDLTRRNAGLVPAQIDPLMAAAQRLEQMVTAHRLQRPIPQADDLLPKLDLATLFAADAPALVAPAPPIDPAFARLAALQARGLKPWRCTFTPTRELDQRGVNTNSIRARLGALGEIVSAKPSVHGGAIEIEFLLGLRETPADLAAWQQDSLVLSPFSLPAPAPAPAEAPSPAPAPSPAAPSASQAVSDQSGNTSLSIAPSHTVRVDLSRLDDLMQIAGELVIQRSRLEERINQVAGLSGEVKEAQHALARTVRQLRHAITRVRLVPVAEIFARMPFVLRDLARDQPGEIRLTLEGQHTEIDKYLVERLKEPLLHLVRNAVSHGVEPPAERTAAGKPVVAALVLRAATAGEFVLIQVRDDGRGVDAAKVARRAATLGLPVPEPLNEAGILQLLCTAGFSMREEADRAAGRGVGMNVVYNTVRELGGTMTLETTLGCGTQFTLRLPMSLMIAETIIVSAAEQTWAVPQRFITEIIQVPAAEARTIKRAEVIPYRDGVLPLLHLRSVFGGHRGELRPQLTVLVLNSERGSTGLVVDRVHAQREIVVRPIQDPLLQVPGVSGATELGDGRPVLVLDPIAITGTVVRPHAGGSPAGANQPADLAAS